MVLKSLITQQGFSGDLPVIAVEMMQKVSVSDMQMFMKKTCSRE